MTRNPGRRRRDSINPPADIKSKYMHQKLQNIKNEALAQILSSEGREELDRLRTHYLGKKGVLNQIAGEFKKLDREQRVDIGRLFNDVKAAISDAFNSKNVGISGIPAGGPTTSGSEIDVTLAGFPHPVGHLHPNTVVAREINAIFTGLGFSVADGPELETEEFNYTRLNLPPDHPARDLQDTLYVKEPEYLLRTHTSSVEARILAVHRPPYRFVFPGKAYRNENANASNTPMFTQYQGLAVGQGITLANLKHTLETFVTGFYGSSAKSRFRCKYYPEVEPGVGMDISCPFCNFKGCMVCKYRGWIEILGAGMIHPSMLEMVKLDPLKFTGFAWGMGLDRIAMTRYGINDIRALFNGNLAYI